MAYIWHGHMLDYLICLQTLFLPRSKQISKMLKESCELWGTDNVHWRTKSKKSNGGYSVLIYNSWNNSHNTTHMKLGEYHSNILNLYLGHVKSHLGLQVPASENMWWIINMKYYINFMLTVIALIIYFSWFIYKLLTNFIFNNTFWR